MTDFSTLLTLLEEPLKSKIAQLFFSKFTYQGGKIDFIITQKHKTLGELNLLWAEAKKDSKASLDIPFIQLILTIGKHRFHTHQTPNFLGAFDGEKFAFLPFGEVQKVFVQNDIDWSVTPSNHKSEQFQTLLNSLETTLAKKQIFYYERDEKELKDFIAKNLNSDHISKYQIDKNNFFNIYLKWREVVRDTISADWDRFKAMGIVDADFYLADLLSDQGKTIIERLNTILVGNYYKTNRADNVGDIWTKESAFKDSQVAHKQFWSLYERPPRKEFWDYIIERRDLLVPQDIRERKGAFFTPSIWVAQSQAYLAKALGEDWQDEYYIWDCAGGTGNLLAGLTNARNIFCSTLDSADVKIIHERIANGANLLENHIFQFDFLNDEFFDQKDSQGNITKKSNLPDRLQDILRDEVERKKLIIYINPPYAEATTTATQSKTGKHKSGVATGTAIYARYKDILGGASRELFTQFFMRIYKEISGCVLASFSTPKYLNAQNSKKFRKNFLARFLGGFIVPAATFDNVTSDFPVNFLIWDTKYKEEMGKIKLDIFDKSGQFLGQKNFYANHQAYIIEWLRKSYDKKNKEIGFLRMIGTDFQTNQNVFFASKLSPNDIKKCLFTTITPNNIIEMSVYLAVRQALPHTWINDRDQFYAPYDSWQEDREFQSDCLAFILFHRQNKISSQHGANHFIPFSEKEVKAKSAFASNFMERFIAGKLESSANNTLFAGGGGANPSYSHKKPKLCLMQAGSFLPTTTPILLPLIRPTLSMLRSMISRSFFKDAMKRVS